MRGAGTDTVAVWTGREVLLWVVCTAGTTVPTLPSPWPAVFASAPADRDESPTSGHDPVADCRP